VKGEIEMRRSRLMLVTGLMALVMTSTWLGCASAKSYDNRDSGEEAKSLQDHDITIAVENAMEGRYDVPSYRIDVRTQDGIVTLTGSVYNLLERGKATTIAESIKGVRSVVNEISVEPIVRSDEEIHSDVVDALFADPATDSFDVNTTVVDGIVTLSGTVDSTAKKLLCEDVVKGVRGVKEVKDNLNVLYEEGRSDSEIEETIEDLLRNDARIDAHKIDVNVHDGNVRLSGSIGSALERSQARSDAWAGGAYSVDTSHLKVDYASGHEMRQESKHSFRADQEIEAAIQNALVQDPRVYSFDVLSDSDMGRVTLTGVVDNVKARQAAEEDARNTLGVWSVRNHIRVRPRTKVSDDELIKRVSRALHRDPYLDREDITVSAYQGKVYLYGKVGEDFERSRAEDDAIRINGVIQVVDYLQVRDAKRVKSDWAIKRDIEDRLLWDAALAGDSITVQVDHSEATLTGTVDSRYDYFEAEKDAYAGGAKFVDNDLHLGFEPQ